MLLCFNVHFFFKHHAIDFNPVQVHSSLTNFWLIIFLKIMRRFFLSFFFFWKVMEKYLVPDYTDVHEFLSHLGKRLGKLKKGKIVKLNVWNEWSKNYSILLGLFMLFEW